MARTKRVEKLLAISKAAREGRAEYARMAVEEALLFEMARDDYHRGEMGIEEAYDRGIIDEFGYEILP